MTNNDLMKRLNKINKDKMVMFKEDKGWSNIHIEEIGRDIIIICDANNSPFSDDN